MGNQSVHLEIFLSRQWPQTEETAASKYRFLDEDLYCYLNKFSFSLLLVCTFIEEVCSTTSQSTLCFEKNPDIVSTLRIKYWWTQFGIFDISAVRLFKRNLKNTCYGMEPKRERMNKRLLCLLTVGLMINNPSWTKEKIKKIAVE